MRIFFIAFIFGVTILATVPAEFPVPIKVPSSNGQPLQNTITTIQQISVSNSVLESTASNANIKVQ
jgi:hypothetical protein